MDTLVRSLKNKARGIFPAGFFRICTAVGGLLCVSPSRLDCVSASIPVAYTNVRGCAGLRPKVNTPAHHTTGRPCAGKLSAPDRYETERSSLQKARNGYVASRS